MVATPVTLEAEWTRDPNLLPVGAPYHVQVINGIGYFLDQPGIAGKAVCSMVLATGYGEAAEEGLDYAAEQMGFTPAAKTRFRQDDQDFVAPITQLRNAKCDLVVLASLPAVTGKVLGTAAQLGYAPRWIGTSPSWHHALAASPLKDYLARKFWQSWDGPAMTDTTEAGVRTMLAAQAKYATGQAPDWYYYGGYIMAFPIHAMLERAVAAGNLTRAGIRAASFSADTVESDGLVSPDRKR